jgi:hypothetical protein
LNKKSLIVLVGELENLLAIYFQLSLLIAVGFWLNIVPVSLDGLVAVKVPASGIKVTQSASSVKNICSLAQTMTF